MLSLVSTDAASVFEMQLGDAGGFETAGYLSTCLTAESASSSSQRITDAFAIGRNAAAGNTMAVTVTLTLRNSANFSWNCEVSGALTAGATRFICGGGSKDLSAELTQIRITTGGGDTFDAGEINIQTQ